MLRYYWLKARSISGLLLAAWLTCCVYLTSSAKADHGALSPDLQAISDGIKASLELSDQEKQWLKDHPKIRIGFDPAFGPYTLVDKAGHLNGIAADYLHIIIDVLGLSISYDPNLDWSGVISSAKAKTIDVVVTAAKTPERQTYLEFTEFSIPTPLVVISRVAEADNLRHADHIVGKKVALVKNYASSMRVAAEFPGIIPVMTNSPIEALRAVAGGDADAHVGVLGVMTYLARTQGLTNLVVASPFDLSPLGQYYGIRQDWPELRQLFDKVLQAMSIPDRIKIMDAWIPTAKQSEIKEPTLALSSGEMSYLRQRAPVTICVDPDWMPYEKINEKGQHIGIAADYIDMFANSLGLKIKLVATKSWAESEQRAQNRDCDIMSLLNKSDRRSEFLNFTEPYIEAPIILVAKRNEPYIDGLKAMTGRSIGIVKGYIYEDLIRKEFPGIKIIYGDTINDVLEKVSEGKIDASLGSLYVVTSGIQQLGLSNLKIAGHTKFKHRLRVGVRNDDPILLSLFEKAVAARTPEDENEILRRWVSVRLEHGFDYDLFWKLLGGIAVIVGFLVYRSVLSHRYNAELKKSNQTLKSLSRIDPLTGICNRLKLDEVLSYEISRSGRSGQPLSVILADIDKFKNFNDKFGHQVGDDILKHFAGLFSANIRKTDTFGRWGGEEFLIICPDTPAKLAANIAEKLRARLEALPIEQAGTITSSFGIAEMAEGDLPQTFLNRADMALYRAKGKGRNRVEIAPQPNTLSVNQT